MRPNVLQATLAALALATFLLAGCSDRDLSELAPAPINTDGLVFDDDFGTGVDFQFFGDGAVTGTLSIDNAEAALGDASLRLDVPGSDGWTGGAFVASDFRNLSDYDALVFYAKSSVASSLNVAGMANDNTGGSRYDAERGDIPVGTDWSLVVVPIPDPARLTLERGLFYFAEATDATSGNEAFTLWMDEVRFTRVGTILDPRPSMQTRSVDTFVGSHITGQNTSVTFAVNGQDVTVSHNPAYFNYATSDSAVVVPGDGDVVAVGGGTAIVTAKLDTVDAGGQITVSVLAPPADPAPAPTHAAGDVICLFSDVYDDVPVDTWRAEWSAVGAVEDMDIDGDAVKSYTGLVYAGIEFTSSLIDASDMTHFSLDVWAPSGSVFRVKLVDFGPDGVFGGGDDSEDELMFHALTDPVFEAGRWCTLDIPLANFVDLDAVTNLAQLVISSSDARTVFVDNVLFHR